MGPAQPQSTAGLIRQNGHGVFAAAHSAFERRGVRPFDVVTGREQARREADRATVVQTIAKLNATLPLIRDVRAAGLTPDELAEKIQVSLREFITDASVTVVVRQMNSRKVFITGEVAKPGAYPLASTTTVLQLIAVAGGLNEFAEANEISVLRVEDGKTTAFRVAYKDIAKGQAAVASLQKKAGVAAADAKARMDVDLTALQTDLKSAEAKLAQMKQATAMRWREFEADVNAATARVRKSTEKAQG